MQSKWVRVGSVRRFDLVSSFKPQAIAPLERAVRCRDCAHAYQRGGGIYCSLFLRWGRNDNPVPLPVEPDGFCAWGSERDGE